MVGELRVNSLFFFFFSGVNLNAHEHIRWARRRGSHKTAKNATAVGGFGLDVNTLLSDISPKFDRDVDSNGAVEFLSYRAVELPRASVDLSDRLTAGILRIALALGHLGIVQFL